MEYARAFDSAVRAIENTSQFPGQIIPGMWSLNEGKMVPAVLISVIIADALGAASRSSSIPFDFLMARYAKVMEGQPIEIKGSPDQIAKAQLRKAAALIRAETGIPPGDAQISLEAAADVALAYLETLVGADKIITILRGALETSRSTHDG